MFISELEYEKILYIIDSHIGFSVATTIPSTDTDIAANGFGRIRSVPIVFL